MSTQIKYLVLMILFYTVYFNTTAQNHYPLQFIDYKDYKAQFNQGENLSGLNEKFNLLFILLLDSSTKDILYSHFPELEDELKQYTSSLECNETTVGFVTEKRNLKEVIRSRETQDRIFNSVYKEQFTKMIESKISFPVYIKGNTAVLEIFSSFTTDIYYVKFHKGVVQINWLSGTIE